MFPPQPQQTEEPPRGAAAAAPSEEPPGAAQRAEPAARGAGAAPHLGGAGKAQLQTYFFVWEGFIHVFPLLVQKIPWIQWQNLANIPVTVLMSVTAWWGLFLVCSWFDKYFGKAEVPGGLSVLGDCFFSHTCASCQPSNFTVLPLINFALAALLGCFRHLSSLSLFQSAGCVQQPAHSHSHQFCSAGELGAAQFGL